MISSNRCGLQTMQIKHLAYKHLHVCKVWSANIGMTHDSQISVIRTCMLICNIIDDYRKEYQEYQDHKRQSWGIRWSRPPRFWAGGRRGWTGLGKHYSLFWTVSTLESVFFLRKREKLAKNVGAKGENVNILGEKAIFWVDD